MLRPHEVFKQYLLLGEEPLLSDANERKCIDNLKIPCNSQEV